jgi:hypothetical protein
MNLRGGEAVLGGHTTDRREGFPHPGLFLRRCNGLRRAYIATLLDTDEAGAREALLAVHDNIAVNAGWPPATTTDTEGMK